MNSRDKTTERSPLARLNDFLERDQWVPDLKTLPFLKALGLKCLRVAWLTVRGFKQDNCLFRASALTYVTVLSLVPLLAVSFSLAKGFGFLESFRTETIDPFMTETFGPSESEIMAQMEAVAAGVPARDLEEEMDEATVKVVTDPEVPAGSEGARELRKTIDGLMDFVQDTDFTGLSAVGLLLLLYAVLRLLATVEKSLNLIWGVQKSRSLVRKVADYLTIVIATPLLLFAAAGITVKSRDLLLSLDSWLFDSEAQQIGVEGVVQAGSQEGGLVAALAFVFVSLAPLIASAIGFAFVYMVMPNTKTKVVSALLGGLLAGGTWQLAQMALMNGLIKVAGYNAIYVGFASFPILMIWIYISWITVFLGAELASAHQGEPAYRQIARSHPTDHAFKETVALRLVARIGRAFAQGDDAKTVTTLAEELALPLRSCSEIVEKLVEHDVLARTESRGEPGVLPARALERITVKSVLDALKGSVGSVNVPSDSQLDRYLDGLLSSLNDELEQSSSNCSLRELAERAGEA